MGCTTAIGLAVYFLVFRVYVKRQNEEAMEEIGKATSDLMRVVGWLFTMVYFGIYRPRPAFVWLLSFYTAFVGVVIYLIVAMSSPFHGATAVDSAPLQFVLEEMRERQASAKAPATEVFVNHFRSQRGISTS